MKVKPMVSTALLAGVLLWPVVCDRPAAKADASPAAVKAQGVFRQKMAEARTKDFDGRVLSHDVACHCVVVETAGGTLTLQEDYARFDEGLDRAKGLESGKRVRGTYKTVDYVDYAMEIRQPGR